MLRTELGPEFHSLNSAGRQPSLARDRELKREDWRCYLNTNCPADIFERVCCELTESRFAWILIKY